MFTNKQRMKVSLI